MTLGSTVALVMLAALTLYALFGGADYGGGVWDLFASGPRRQAQRDLISRAIGPVWEANHVWLILVVVVLFTAFPDAFYVVMTRLHLPISLMLVGIVLRGSAFTFRTYDLSPGADHRWNHRFSIPSAITPILLGSIIGSIATGKLEAPGGPSLWFSPFPMAVGGLTLWRSSPTSRRSTSRLKPTTPTSRMISGSGPWSAPWRRVPWRISFTGSRRAKPR